jgi:hypothetical protein
MSKKYADRYRAFIKIILKVGVEESIVNALYGLRISCLNLTYLFRRVVRSQSHFEMNARYKMNLINNYEKCSKKGRTKLYVHRRNC